MALFLVTAPATEPVSLAEAKVQCRVDNTDEDSLITDLITAARLYMETATRRKFITQTWDYKCDDFPDGLCPIWLPFSPVSSITSVSYVDTAGATQTWSTSLYDTDLPTGDQAGLASVRPKYQQLYPVTRDTVNAMTVRFVAGYGAAAAVPAGIKNAIKMLVAHWYVNRVTVTLDRVVPSVLPMAVDAAVAQFGTGLL